MKEPSLSGGEISMLRAIGLMGTSIDGETLLHRLSFMEEAEMLDTLRGLMLTGFVIGDRDRFQTIEELKPVNFHVNTAYSRDLRDVISGRTRDRSKRRRRR